jgi:hypothetical protein
MFEGKRIQQEIISKAQAIHIGETITNSDDGLEELAGASADGDTIT